MTLAEKNLADSTNSQRESLNGFSKTFRSSSLNNLEDGESFIIPENYVVYGNKIGNNVAEYINVTTNTGRVVEFYPSAICKIAFAVDDNGKNIRVGDRMDIRRSKGTVADYVNGKSIDATMQKMKGCEILYKVADRVKTRAFGVDEAVATSKDVTTTVLGDWNFVGNKLPEDYVK